MFQYARLGERLESMIADDENDSSPFPSKKRFWHGSEERNEERVSAVELERVPFWNGQVDDSNRLLVSQTQ
jgi:hypothetical protein